MFLAYGQAPDKFSFQAIVRNSSNMLVINQTIGMRISILQATSTGTAVYVETQTPTSNANGLITLEVGAGTVVSGSISGINWNAGPYFIKTETDPDGGANYSIIGVTQILSVPFASYAKSAGNSWTTSGNSGTDPLTQFLGTTDAHDFIFKTNNAERMRIFSDGKMCIGGNYNAGAPYPLEVRIPSTTGSQFVLKLTNLLSPSYNSGSGVGLLFSPDDAAIAKMGIMVERKGAWGVGTMHFLSRTSSDYASADLSNSVMALTQNGYLGIGNTSPTTRLDVSGVITATGGNSGNWNTAYGWGNHATAGYLTSFAEKDTMLWKKTGSDIYFNAGKIGIGTTTPGNTFSVNGTADFSTAVKTATLNPLAGDASALVISTNDGSTTSGSITIKTGNTVSNGATTGSITLMAGHENWTSTHTDGGYLNLGGYANYNSGGGVLLRAGNSWADAGSVTIQGGNAGSGKGGDLYLNGGNGGSGLGGPGSVIVNAGSGGSKSTGYVGLQINGTEQMRVNYNGFIGMGTSTPATKLDVNGVITTTGGNSSNWNTAYGWGNHASAGYLTAESQALRVSNDTIYLTNGGFVKLPEQKSTPALITKDDFSSSSLKNFWSSAVTGAATITLSNSVATLSTNGAGNTAKLYSNKQKSLNDGKLVFTAVLYTYEDNNTAYGPLVRGLVNGTDRNNAIEFINVSGNTIQARTVSGGTATATNYSVGASVANFYAYSIIASKTKVEFYLDGNLIATHTTNIPTTNLNMYFDASTWSGNVPQVIDDAKFEITK
jgi:hypothetical protein